MAVLSPLIPDGGFQKRLVHDADNPDETDGNPGDDDTQPPAGGCRQSEAEQANDEAEYRYGYSNDEHGGWFPLSGSILRRAPRACTC